MISLRRILGIGAIVMLFSAGFAVGDAVRRTAHAVQPNH